MLSYSPYKLTWYQSSSNSTISSLNPVLILTGDCDRLVPSWNAKRLSQSIPGSCFEVIKNCGHLPHEEKPDEFLSAVANFLYNTFGDSQAQPVQAFT